MITLLKKRSPRLKSADETVYMYGFAKSERTNIRAAEEKKFFDAPLPDELIE